MAQVTPQTANALLRTIDQRLSQGMTHLHLMLSSPGGSVFHGLSLHNFLKGCGAQISTYNFASVDSIGVVIFCAGSQRYCVPNARFHIHGVKFGYQGNVTFDEKGLEEQLKLLKTDYTNIARVIATNTGRTEKQVVGDMNKQTSLMPENAKEYGLVHHIRPELIPAGAGMSVIYEDGAVFEYKAVPQQQSIPMPEQSAPTPAGNQDPGQDQPGARGFTGQSAFGYTQSPMSFTGFVAADWDSKNYSSFR